MSVSVYWLPPALDDVAARARLERRRRGCLGRWLPVGVRLAYHGRRTAPGESSPLELVYLPCALVALEADRLPECQTAACFVVHGWTQTVQVVPEEELAGDAPPNCEPEFEYPLSDEETLHLVEAQWVRLRLSRVVRGRGLTQVRLRLVGRVHYPFWVLHFAKRNGRLDFAMLDARTGQFAGSASRSAFLQALAAQAQE